MRDSRNEIDRLQWTIREYKRDWRIERTAQDVDVLLRYVEQSVEENNAVFLEEPRQVFPEWWERLTDGDALHYVGAAFVKWGLFDLAVPILERASSVIPDNPDVWVDLGVAYAQYDVLRGLVISKAMSTFYRALSLDPGLTIARDNIKILGRKVIDYYASAFESKDALGIGEAESRAMWLNLGDCHAMLSQYDNAVECFAKVFDDPSHGTIDPERRLNFALSLEGIGNEERAFRVLKETLDRMDAEQKWYPYVLWNALSFFARRGMWSEYVSLHARMSANSALASFAARHKAMVEEEEGTKVFLGISEK